MKLLRKLLYLSFNLLNKPWPDMLNKVWLIFFYDKCSIAWLHYHFCLFTISTNISFHHVQEYENILLLDLRKYIKRKIVQTIYKSFLSKTKQNKQKIPKNKHKTVLYKKSTPNVIIWMKNLKFHTYLLYLC